MLILLYDSAPQYMTTSDIVFTYLKVRSIHIINYAVVEMHSFLDIQFSLNALSVPYLL